MGFTKLWEAVRDQQDVISGTFAWSTPKPFDLTRGGIGPNVQVLMVSGEFFDTLGDLPAAGRLIARRGRSPGLRTGGRAQLRVLETRFGGPDGRWRSSREP